MPALANASQVSAYGQGEPYHDHQENDVFQPAHKWLVPCHAILQRSRVAGALQASQRILRLWHQVGISHLKRGELINAGQLPCPLEVAMTQSLAHLI